MLPGIYELRRICSFLKLTSCVYTYLQTRRVVCIKYVWLFVCQSWLDKVVKTQSWQTQGSRWKSLLPFWARAGEGVHKGPFPCLCFTWYEGPRRTLENWQFTLLISTDMVQSFELHERNWHLGQGVLLILQGVPAASMLQLWKLLE